MAATPKHTLLVVDDEQDLVQSVKDLLRLDFRVLGAYRASEGMQILRREPVHIVMTDQRMPGMSGVEFLKSIKESHPDTIRLLFTAYADIDTVADAINQGSVFRYINKPWQPQELRGVLKQASEQYDLLAERKQLMGEVQEKNRQLEQAIAELRLANDLKKAFIKVASHELRTPLTIILGLSELAYRADQAPPPLREWLEHIYKGSIRLNERVDQMVKLLMAERYEKNLQAGTIDMADLVRRAAAEVRSFVEQRRQLLRIEAADDLGLYRGEEDKLYDCVVQLLINAIKFTPDGGTITVSAQKTPEGGIALAVADSGVGIDAASLPRVFDPFFTRFDVSRHSSGVFEFDRRGLGLGLSVVKAFVDMHRGKVVVQSELKKGTTFQILLPPAP